MLSIESSNTYKEIFQQPEVWRSTYSIILNKKTEILTFLSEFYSDDVTIVFTGAGTSSFIGNIMSFILPKYNYYSVKSAPTTDITTHPHAFFNSENKYILVSLARSGNSPESIAAYNLANEICGKNIAHIVITCNSEGELAKKADNNNVLLLVLPSETNDKGLAMTSSFSSMLISSMLLLDIENIEENKKDLYLLSNKAVSLLNLYTEKLQEIAEMDFERAVFLGSGERRGIAEECHLKLQELTDGKIVCMFDTYLGFRHGPKAVLNDKTILIYLISPDEDIYRYEKDLISQINRQIKPVAQIYVSNKTIKIDDIEFDLEMIPENGEKTIYDVVLHVIVGQLLGMYKSKQLGLNPDNPSTSGKISRVVEGVTIY